jgi:hypothetical protein
MKLLLLLLIGLSLCGACQKDEKSNEPVTPLPNAWVGPQKHGWGKCKRDGVEWEGSGSWNYIYSDSSKIGFAFSTYDSDTMMLEQVGMFLIPLKPGKYVLSASTGNFTKPSGSYWVGYYDETDASYKIDESRSNYLWLDAYDPVKKVAKGRFQAHFLRKESNLHNYPEEVSFEDGEFEVGLYQ